MNDGADQATSGRERRSTRRAVVFGSVAAAGAASLAACTSSAHDTARDTAAGRPGTSDAKEPGTAGGVVSVVADFGAKGDGRTDDSAAFARAYAHARARVADHTGRTVIDVPPGRYLVTGPGALLNGDTPGDPANGLRLRGAGKRITEIVFRPSGADAYLCSNNDTWANLSFEGMTFTSATPGASFFYSYSTGNVQDYRFSDCEWLGEWTYGLALDGSDTNSEMRWEACRVGGSYRKAFLYCGLSQRSKDPAAQDQFLNYWFTDMKVEYAWGNFLEFPYGGSVTCRGGSYIVTGTRPHADPEYGTTSTFFRFPRATHAASVQRFHAEDIRFELRNPDVLVIDSHWSGGTIRFNDCDDTALAFKPFSTALTAHRYDVGPRGPLVRYDSCQLTGTHTYRTPQSAPGRTVARYDMCHFATASQSAMAGPGTAFTDCLDHA
ncbi:glycosyl hydrolase family 28-related protein [Streptomyces sp. SL13]|uniref:Glycosyl hydrolase family 28-related protein n=1 Tax=Streptantibioticus silvisoli TaxID=2705255 RepID=A0AA90H596_9ACTN|nr:glycosyl hydrolase family 28-related protein [Streptantibioticus silvisoli]MDI5969065.1 glycosyl hydrolase family 28-related protein [Streptantibioticus silvisoli]